MPLPPKNSEKKDEKTPSPTLSFDKSPDTTSPLMTFVNSPDPVKTAFPQPSLFKEQKKIHYVSPIVEQKNKQTKQTSASSLNKSFSAPSISTGNYPSPLLRSPLVRAVIKIQNEPAEDCCPRCSIG